jgi:D-alanyl-D-alanine carboxypeptidase
VTGTSLGTQLDQRIFKPLKLESTSLPTTPDITGPHAHGYFVMGPQGAVDVTSLSPSIAWAGGGIVSNTTDVSGFYRALLEGRLLPAELMKQMMTTVVDDQTGRLYGLGIEKKEFPCGTAWGHPGNFPGYYVASYSTADASKQLTVAFNLDSTSMEKAQGEATDKLQNDAFCGVS